MPSSSIFFSINVFYLFHKLEDYIFSPVQQGHLKHPTDIWRPQNVDCGPHSSSHLAWIIEKIDTMFLILLVILEVVNG